MFTNGIWIGLGIVVAVFVIVPAVVLLAIIVFGGFSLLFSPSSGPPDAESARRKALGYGLSNDAEAREFLKNNAEQVAARENRVREIAAKYKKDGYQPDVIDAFSRAEEQLEHFELPAVPLRKAVDPSLQVTPAPIAVPRPNR
jgi:hypothetical protein